MLLCWVSELGVSSLKSIGKQALFCSLERWVYFSMDRVYEVLCDLFRDSQTDNIVSTDYKFYSCTAVYVHCCNLGLGSRDRCSFSN